MSSPISVRLSDGSKLEVAVVDLDAATVLLLKEQISDALPDKPPASSLKIVFKGKVRTLALLSETSLSQPLLRSSETRTSYP